MKTLGRGIMRAMENTDMSGGLSGARGGARIGVGVKSASGAGRQEKLWLGLTVVIVVLAAMLVGGLVFWDIMEDRRVDAVAVTLKEDLMVAFGEEAKVSDFLEELKGDLIDDHEIRIEHLGETAVEFEYVSVRGKRRTSNFVIEVVDRTAPRIYGSNEYTVAQGYEGDLTDLMLSGDDLHDSPRREIVGDYDINKVGEYSLVYVVTDMSGNVAKKDFVLRVVEPRIEEEETPSNPLPKLEFAEAKREYGGEGAKVGIDVSQWQGEIDWQRVKDAGVEFAMIRVGYQEGYGGKCVLDPYFVENMLGATELAGLPVGVYFYSYATTKMEAKEQARWVEKQLSGFGVELGVAFDWEDWGNFNRAGVSFYKLNSIAKVFLDAVGEYGAKAVVPHGGMLYSSKVYLERIWEDLGYPVWLAQYYDRATYAGDYQMWQLSNTGRVDGIEGDVDIDVWYTKNHLE